jgi:thiamine-monophosphate kinase
LIAGRQRTTTSGFGEFTGNNVMAGLTGEHAFVEWVRRRTPTHPDVKIGPGDDAAVLTGFGTADLIVTTDMLLDGSCFSLSEAGPRRVGRKAMGVNLSDIAAMAGIPRAAVVSVGLPRTGGQSIAEELFLGMKELASEFNTPIVGGDTNSWDGPLVISVTVLGTVGNKGPVARNSAKSGDWLFVTGPLGGSILGHHLDFTPRVHEALELHERFDLHAMIDISDGFALDLHRLCEASGCGAIVDADKVPVSDAARRLNDDKSPLEHALGDGEDFELLFAVPRDDGEQLLHDSTVPVFFVGECIEAGLHVKQDNVLRALNSAGYEHRFE